MIKLTGLMGLVLASGLLGIMKAEILRERIWLLEDFMKMVMELKSQMNYFKEPLPSIFLKTSQKASTPAFQLLGRCQADLMEKDAEMSEIWLRNIIEVYGKTPVTREDTERFITLGTFAGQTDCENQKMQFGWLLQGLEEQIEEARNTYRQKGSMYRRIGFFSGTLAALVLL